MTIDHTKSLPLETWQFPHSDAYVSHEKDTRSNHACSSSIRNRSKSLVLLWKCWFFSMAPKHDPASSE